MSTDIKKVDDAIEFLEQLKDHLTCEASIEPPLTTPSGIKFMVNSYGQVIGLCFNDKQVLGYSLSGVFTVHPICSYIGNPVEGLPLKPCKYEDLKPGEFFDLKTSGPYLVVGGGYYVIIEHGCDVRRWKAIARECEVLKIG